MKALIVNGSPRRGGNCSLAIKEMAKVFEEEGIEATVRQIGDEPIRGCTACGACRKEGRCVYDDEVNELARLFEESDALIVVSPVYYASANATLVAFLQRLFHSTSFDKSMKVGASVVVARRGGCTAAFDELNKFFSISSMPIATSCYWNMVHGLEEGEAKEDEEGLATVRCLARNAAFLMKSIALGKERYGLPRKEKMVATNFIRK